MSTRHFLELRYIQKNTRGIPTFLAAFFFSAFFILFLQRFRGVGAKGPEIEFLEIASAFFSSAFFFLYCFGLVDTMRALDMGAVETLLMYAGAISHRAWG